MKKTVAVTVLCLAVLIPATLYLGTQLSGRWYYLTSTLVILEAMLPFFLSFEARRPQARELVTIAVMAALAVAGRVAIPVPNFKAITGIIILAGMAFGPQAGFMTGAIAAFASNFFYAQGPWTPWQMLAYGMGGLIGGLVFGQKDTAWHKTGKAALLRTVFAFVTIFLLVGPLLDTCTIFTTAPKLSWRYARAVYVAGIPHNLIHAASGGATVLLLGAPLLQKLSRIKTKYGMLR